MLVSQSVQTTILLHPVPTYTLLWCFLLVYEGHYVRFFGRK